MMLAISSSNSGGAFDNAKKYVEGQKLEMIKSDIDFFKEDQEVMKLFLDEENKPEKEKKDKLYFPISSGPHEAAVIGDTVGDPLKDTSGPSLNILIKLSTTISLIFGTCFDAWLWF